MSIDTDSPISEPPRESFAATLWRVTPRVWVTYVLLGASIGVYAIMVARGVSPLQPAARDLADWGANFAPLTGAGQPWRLFTCMFLHIGLLHLALNMWILWDAGPIVERLFGNIGFLLLYVLSGITASMASYLWSGPVVSAGASGAIFGLIGGLLAFTVAQGDAVPWQILSGFRNSALAFVGFNIVAGFFIPNVDMAAHLGGFVGGVVCGLILRQRFSPGVVRWRWLRNLACLLLVGGAQFGAWAVLPKDPIADALSIERIEKQVVEAFQRIEQEMVKGSLTEAEAADRIEREALKPWKAARERVNGLDRWPGKERLDTVKKYFRIREEAFELEIRGLREKDQALRIKAQQLINESADLLR